jgi:hypothetical protein
MGGNDWGVPTVDTTVEGTADKTGISVEVGSAMVILMAT